MKSGASKRPRGTTCMYVAGTIVALIALAYLISNVLFFRDTVAQYVAQGYPAAEVFWGLLPGQLLPGLFQPIAVYGGIATLLFGAGMINQKVTQGLDLLSKDSAVEERTEAAASMSEEVPQAEPEQ